jgi:uncharacterized damage-inducible protein DinB
MDDSALRDLLRRGLDWEDAHARFDDAMSDVPESVRGKVPPGTPHSLWHLLEHMRRVQWDILDFCRNPAYEEHPAEWHWPSSPAPKDAAEWDESMASFRRDRDAMKQLAADRSIDLFAKIPHGSGQTYLREIILVIDHNSYHLGQLIIVRRLLGAWPRS